MLKKATLGKRALAFAVDILLLSVATSPLFLLVGESMLRIGIAGFLSIIFYLVYFALMEGIYGQTIGKVAAKIEVKFESGFKWGGAIIRNVTKAISAAIPFFLLLDVIFLFFDEERRRFSELPAKTKVIMEWKRLW